MTPKVPGTYARMGMPVSASEPARREREQTQDDRQFAPRDQALAFAASLAERNAELMRRLA